MIQLHPMAVISCWTRPSPFLPVRVTEPAVLFTHFSPPTLHPYLVVLVVETNDYVLPELRHVQHVSFVDAAHFAAPLGRHLKGHLGYPLDFRLAVNHVVEARALARGGVGGDALGFAEVYVARELAHHLT